MISVRHISDFSSSLYWDAKEDTNSTCLSPQEWIMRHWLTKLPMKLATVSMCLNTLISSTIKFSSFSLFHQILFLKQENLNGRFYSFICREDKYACLSEEQNALERCINGTLKATNESQIKRENTSLGKWAFFGKVNNANLTAIIDLKRWLH